MVSPRGCPVADAIMGISACAPACLMDDCRYGSHAWQDYQYDTEFVPIRALSWEPNRELARGLRVPPRAPRVRLRCPAHRLLRYAK
jgi:hypothetical protein